MPPGMPCAYSGEAKTRPSASRIERPKASTAGGVNSPSLSGLKIGNSPIRPDMSSVTPAGAFSASARSSAVLVETRRRLPDRPRSLMSLGGLGGLCVGEVALGKFARQFGIPLAALLHRANLGLV